MRDELRCLSDFPPGNEAGGDSFFYIEGVFYVDDRGSNIATDASNWMLQNIGRIHEFLLATGSIIFPNPEIPSTDFEICTEGVRYKKAAPEIKSMHATNIEDLYIGLHSKYLFCHENRCEHFVYFTKIRSHDLKRDRKYWPSYPCTVEQVKMPRRKCQICCLLNAKYVIFGDRLAPHNPHFCCEQCEFMLHYTVDGNLIYDDFHIFPYSHDVPH